MTAKLLIVEDSSPMREVILDYLTGEGYDCEAAENGNDGKELLEKNQYNLLLTDLRLPGVDGFALIEIANRCQQDMPKIIMTAFSEMEDALRALRLGAYDFIHKPIRSMPEFGLVIKRALEHGTLLHERSEHLREIEKLNHNLEQEVERRTEELSRANQQLRTLDEMKNNLLANVSHELRTPLVSVRGYTELFQSGKLCHIPDEYQKYLDTCLRNTDKLLSLIESLVHHAELAREEVALNIVTKELTEVIRQVLSEATAAAEKRRISIEFHGPDDPVLAKVDLSRFREALRHLVSNAIKFSNDGGEVVVRVEPIGKHLTKVSITDTGEGIAPGEHVKIFERFYQTSSGPTRQHGGTGIGLAIVRDNLRLMGCEIRVSSAPGEGSTFYFTIPTQIVE